MLTEREGRCEVSGADIDALVKQLRSRQDDDCDEAAATITALQAEVERLRRSRDRYREQWENEKRRFAETMAALERTKP